MGRAEAAIRVLIADDEPLITEGIRSVLNSAPDLDVVAVARDGRTAVDLAVRHHVDVSVLDITMPVLDGLAALRSLRDRAPWMRALMLTAFGEQSNVLRALEYGAAGFVVKNCAPDELVRAVRAAHAGDAYLSPAVARMVMAMVAPEEARRRSAAAKRLAGLAPRESQVLRLLAEGLSNAEIGRALGMSEPTVKTYVSRILTKLDCANRVQAALLARDAGAGSSETPPG
jgi:DNA-binding NarL/FixJ family response regulator